MRRRATHDYDAYDEGLRGAADLSQQKGIDGVVGAPGEILPGSIRTEQIADTAVIQNAVNVQNGPATVTIDDSGLVIENGAVTFKDAFGSTVLDGLGFSSSWRKFVASQIYNSDFSAGAASVSASEVSFGDSDADYLASLSPDLPYWVVEAVPAGATLGVVADALASSGRALTFDDGVGGVGSTFFYQDVPIDPGVFYVVAWTLRADHRGGSILATDGSQWRDATHGLVSGGVTWSATFTSDVTGYTTYLAAVGVAPASARYLRVRFGLAVNAPGGQVWFSSVSVIRDAEAGSAFPSSPYTGRRFFRTDLGMQFYYDGSQWLSTQVFTCNVGFTALSSLSATTANVGWGAIDLMGGSNAYLLKATAFAFVNPGTALGASHSWSFPIDKAQDSSTTLTTVATPILNSGPDGVRQATVSINALLNGGSTYDGFRFGVTKVGTPGAIFCSVVVTYRVVAV